MSEPIVIKRKNSVQMSVWELLPLDLIKLIIVQSRNTVMFRVCKLFNSYSSDEDFWMNYAKIVSNGEYPPKQYNKDPRVAVSTPAVTSWKSYAIARYKYNKSVTSCPSMAFKRILVITNLLFLLTNTSASSKTLPTILQKVLLQRRLIQVTSLTGAALLKDRYS